MSYDCPTCEQPLNLEEQTVDCEEAVFTGDCRKEEGGCGCVFTVTYSSPDLEVEEVGT
jgi:hypothetical protein